jgi:inhibitor of KinA sporulation pathway (predicted exonuclease)
LKKALDLLGISFFGTAHNGLDDAFNTAKVFRQIFDQIQLEKRWQTKKSMQRTWFIRLGRRQITRLENWHSFWEWKYQRINK